MNVEWSPRALQEWEHIAHYIYEEFGKKAVIKFEQELAVWENRMAEHPEIAPIELLLKGKKREYRGLIVGKHNKLIYYIEDGIIHIADFWDMRREPVKLSRRME